MWNLLNRKWVPICSFVLSTVMLIVSVYLYTTEHINNYINNNTSGQNIFNVLCVFFMVLSLIIFVFSINLLMLKKYILNNGYIDKYTPPENESVSSDIDITAINQDDNMQHSTISDPLPSHDKDISSITNKLSYKRDALTSLYEFSTFEQVISDKLSNIRPSTNEKHAFLLIDIDDFHLFNESHGTYFSDTLLISFANQLTRNLKDSDMASYIHDNKFAIFLSNVKSDRYIEHITNCINNTFLSINLGNAVPKLTCSIGITIAHKREIDFATLLKEADLALYTAKITGKNKVIYFFEELQETYTKYDTKYLSYSTRPLYSLPLMDSSRIIYSIINLFSDSNNLEISFNLALTLIGSVFNLDLISIYELTEDERYIDTKFSWCSDTFLKHSTTIEKVPMHDYDNFTLYNNLSKDMFSTNAFQDLNLPASSFKYAFTDAQTKCLFQRKISIADEFQGVIIMSSSHTYDDWEGEISTSLTLLGAILANNIEKLRTQQHMQHMIEVDNLTGANNMKAFTTLGSTLISAHPNKNYVIVYFDVDRFTLFNEQRGYTSGDYILKEITKILQCRLTPYETFCRIVDDKFIVLSEYNNHEDFLARLRDFKQQIYNITDSDNNCMKVNISAGISTIDSADNISHIIDEANTARRSIKNKHNIGYAFFNESMKSHQLKLKSLEDVMEDALNNDEFCLYLQPKYNVDEKKVCGAEALVRWNRPGIGLVPPDEFIPIFEENSFIINIDYYIFDKVCELLRSLLDEGKNPVPISVNFSRLHLNNTKILTKLKDNLEKYNLTPDYIEIEITESALADNDSYMYSILNEIHRLGFKLAMDDFGTGMSSLNSLRKLPFDILKLDKDFFHKDHITKREQIVIRNIVRLGKELAMTIVSEGIETKEQISFLKNIKCPIIQGYFFSKPLPKQEFLAKYF